MSNTRVMGNATTTAAHSAENPAPEAGMSRDIINIGLNIFRAGIRRYSEEEQQHLEWLWGYTFDVLGNSKTELCRQIGYDYKFIYDVFTGRYDGELDTFIAAIQQLKQQASQKMPLVETVVVKRLMAAFDYAAQWSAMVNIVGPTGRGKTYAAKYWARQNNHGRTRYIRVPSGCTRRQIVTMLCSSCGIGVNGHKTTDLEQRLFKAFTPRNVIMVDEAGHLVPRSGNTGTAAIELLRDLHDICGCAVIMIFTDVYLKEMKNGRLADYFEQFIGRVKYTLPIPDKIFRGEIEDIVKSFNPDASQRLIELAYKTATARDGKLRTLFEDLRRASDWAQQQGRALQAGDLQVAVRWRESGGIWPEE